MAGQPGCLHRRLLSVLNAAVRWVAGIRRSDPIANTLAMFHWLRTVERIHFKLATDVARSLHDIAQRPATCPVIYTSSC
jgi:hypothetical protein